MKHISEIDNLIEQLNETPQKATLNEDAAKLIDNLFEVLEKHLPFFRSNNCSEEGGYGFAKKEWVKTFLEQNISKELIIKGVKNLRSYPEPLKDLKPLQFIELCRKNNRASIDVNAAYAEACRNSHPSATKSWSHVTVRHAAQGISWELTHEPRRESLPLFEERYLRSIELFERGELKEELPAPEKETTSKTSNLEVGKAHLSNLLQSLRR